MNQKIKKKLIISIGKEVWQFNTNLHYCILMIHFWSEYTNIMYIKSYWDIIVQTYELLDNRIHIKYEPPFWEERRPSMKKDVDQQKNQDNYRTRTNKYTPRTIILIKLYSSWNQDNDLFTSICQHLCLFVTEYCLMQYAFILLILKFHKCNNFIFVIVDNQIEIKLQIFFQPFCLKF